MTFVLCQPLASGGHRCKEYWETMVRRKYLYKQGKGGKDCCEWIWQTNRNVNLYWNDLECPFQKVTFTFWHASGNVQVLWTTGMVPPREFLHLRSWCPRVGRWQRKGKRRSLFVFCCGCFFVFRTTFGRLVDPKSHWVTGVDSTDRSIVDGWLMISWIVLKNEGGTCLKPVNAGGMINGMAGGHNLAKYKTQICDLVENVEGCVPTFNRFEVGGFSWTFIVIFSPRESVKPIAMTILLTQWLPSCRSSGLLEIGYSQVSRLVLLNSVLSSGNHSIQGVSLWAWVIPKQHWKLARVLFFLKILAEWLRHWAEATTSSRAAAPKGRIVFLLTEHTSCSSLQHDRLVAMDVVLIWAKDVVKIGNLGTSFTTISLAIHSCWQGDQRLVF